MVDTWVDLFEVLCDRHNISSLRAFSPGAFAVQLRVPGTVVFLASVGGEVVGMDWWYVQGDVAQGHLAAFSNLGYDVLASYATKWYAMEYFATRVRWMNLGGAPGTKDNGIDGLARFKRGWTSDTHKAYFCGRILNAERKHINKDIDL